MRVKLYRNLAVQYRASPTRPGYVTWTTLYAEGPKRGLAYRHGDGVVLSDVDFEVSEPMRQTTIRMRREGRTKKTTHAFAVGTPLQQPIRSFAFQRAFAVPRRVEARWRIRASPTNFV